MEASSPGSQTLSCLLPLKLRVSRSGKHSVYWNSGLESTWSCLQSFILSVPSGWNAGPLDLCRPAAFSSTHLDS